MNGIEKITEHIEAEARQEAESVRAEAESRCREIREAYEKTAQEEYWKRVKAGVKDCEQRMQRLSKAASMEAKKSVLSVRQEMVACAFERAAELIRELPLEEYTQFLARMAAQASRTGMEELLFNQRDQERCGKAVVKVANELLKNRGLPGKLTMGEEIRPIQGGVIVREGDIETNCSIEVLMEQNRSALALPVSEILFAD